MTFCDRFIAMSNACDMVITQQEIDIFHIVCNVKQAQPHFFKHLVSSRCVYVRCITLRNLESDVSVSQGSVATQLRCGGIFSDNFVADLPLGWIATKLTHDGPQIGLHPGSAQGQGQGQRSRDTTTSVMSRNVCYTVRSHVLSLHALTLYETPLYSPSSISIRQLDV